VKDYQRAKVYLWEDKHVRPNCPAVVLFANGQQYVDGVWLANGWTRPPRVLPLPKQAHATMARANHGQVWLPPKIAGWIVLHELAHALTDDAHGPNFVGMYIDLLERVESLSRLITMFTLKQAKVDFNLGVQPLEWVTRRYPG
jgi:hypothetical protein